MAATNPHLSTLKSITDEANLLSHAAAILAWDQETFMPPAAIAERAQQQAVLSALVHQRLTGSDLGHALEHVTKSGDLAWTDQRLVRQVRRVYDQACKIPEAFIRKMAISTSEAQVAWAQARGGDDFASFRPHLEGIVDLCGEKAGYLGYASEAYDALLDEYEPGMTTKDVDQSFAGLAAELAPLVKTLTAAPQPAADFLQQSFPTEGQERFGRLVLDAMGFDFERGRLDASPHPFTTTLGRDDVRITTHWHETDPTKSLYGIIHEAGHALYELGADSTLPSALVGGTSLGIHESQSRLWENVVGRSQSFWTGFFPELKAIFPAQLAQVGPEDLYRAVNRVEASPVRIHADEVTYSLHIMLRFRLELALMRGQLAVKDLPEAWRAESKSLLGIVPATDAEGCLQDIHWSMGAIGYFPTYALGNLYGAMFMESARRDLPDLDSQIARRNLSPLRQWLADKIHGFGLAKTPGELLADVCGQPLTHAAFMRYLKPKYSALYGLAG